MKYTISILAIALLISLSAFQTKFITKTGTVKFYSDAPMETIEATNKQVNAAIDTETGGVFYKILIKSFVFEKALMQEHFNENYLESDAYPTAKFVGKITNLSDINFNKPGTYEANVKGTIEIHGIKKELQTKGTLKVEKDGIQVNSTFDIKLSDFDISIPGAVTGKISETVQVTIDSKLKALK